MARSRSARLADRWAARDLPGTFYFGIVQLYIGALCLLGLLLPHFRHLNTIAFATFAVLTLILGATVLRFHGDMPDWGAPLAVGWATVFSGGLAWSAGRGTGTTTMLMLYVPIGCFSGFLLTGRAVVIELSLVAALLAAGVMLNDQPGAGQEYLAVFAASLACCLIIYGLAHRLLYLAEFDQLTGLANRRSWEAHLQRELARSDRSGVRVAAAILDLDHFKEINTELGHHGADRVLVDLAHRWTRVVRPSDALGRFGGDEFLLLLVDIDVDDARRLIDRLSEASTSDVTFSAGLAVRNRRETAEEFMVRVDRALMQAKSTGGRRTCVAEDDPGRKGP